jgi:Fe-S cluster biogenesis protein NfuA
MSTPTTEIKIRGEFTADPAVCRFVTNVPLVEAGWTLVFRAPEEATESPLMAAIFADGAIAAATVQGEAIVLTKDSPDHWPKVAQRLLPLMKEHLARGDAIPAALVERLKSQPAGESMARVIAEALERRINPALAAHGGWVRLVEIRDRDVVLEMGGGCQGCSASQQTLRHGVERVIREVCPQVREIVDATDHAAGENPYYA